MERQSVSALARPAERRRWSMKRNILVTALLIAIASPLMWTSDGNGLSYLSRHERRGVIGYGPGFECEYDKFWRRCSSDDCDLEPEQDACWFCSETGLSDELRCCQDCFQNELMSCTEGPSNPPQHCGHDEDGIRWEGGCDNGTCGGPFENVGLCISPTITPVDCP